jgi:predicted alpha/beta hydrolase family esterase
MKKALILHWWEWNSNSHWIPWLACELEAQWYNVIAPDLPGTDYPDLEEQLEQIRYKNLKKKDVIIAHSLWCQLAMKYVAEEKLSWIKVILVAPSYNNLADELWDVKLGDAFTCLSNCFNDPLNFRNVNKLKNKYTVMLSDDDPYINRFSAKEYYWQLDSAEFVDFEWKWHFSSDVWLEQLPEALEYL